MSSVGLLDIHDVFHGLTGCQQTPGFWGVTLKLMAMYVSCVSFGPLELLLKVSKVGDH